MKKILKFENKLSYYLDLIDKREEANDLWGVLDACKNAKRLAKMKADRNSIDLLIGQTYFEMEEYILSLNHFFSVLKIPEMRAGAFFGIAKNLIVLRKYNLALDYFEATLKWDIFSSFSESVLMWTSYIKQDLLNKEKEEENLIYSAKKLMMKNDFKGAEQILCALQTKPKTLSLMAFCAFSQQDYSSAKRLARETLFEEEENVLAIYVLIKVYERENKKSFALGFLKKLEFLKTENPIDLKRIALIFSERKEFYKALPFFEKLAKVKQFNPNNHLFLGLCNNNLNRKNEALFCVSKAMWLDCENPLYMFFYDLIKTDSLDKFCEIKSHLPKEIEEEKVKNLVEIFLSGKFSKEIDKSFMLLEDIEWSFSLPDLFLTEKASNALSNSKNKKATNLFEKMLLKTTPNSKQKFLMIKSALFSGNFLEINFVNNFCYSSFALKKNDISQFEDLNIKEGVCEAISFCECFYPKKMLLNKIITLARKYKKSMFLKNMSSKVVACFLLKNFNEVFDNACLFFKMDKNLIQKLDRADKSINDGEVKDENT